jgi:hypothetical protein
MSATTSVVLRLARRPGGIPAGSDLTNSTPGEEASSKLDGEGTADDS